MIKNNERVKGVFIYTNTVHPENTGIKEINYFLYFQTFFSLQLHISYNHIQEENYEWSNFFKGTILTEKFKF